MTATYASIEEAREKHRDLNKHECELIHVDNKPVIFCGTCLPYEDLIWPHLHDLFEELLQAFPEMQTINQHVNNVDLSSEMRDLLLNHLKNEYNIDFQNQSHEY